MGRDGGLWVLGVYTVCVVIWARDRRGCLVGCYSRID